MTYLTAILLGFVQGVSEILPVSSSGHLAVLQSFFGVVDLQQDYLLFDVLLHLGTLAAIFAAYWPEIRNLAQEFVSMLKGKTSARTQRRPKRRMILLLFVATLPLFLILPVKDKIEQFYYNPFFIGFALIVTGLFLFGTDRVRHGSKTEKTATIGNAVLVGIGQALAVVPGLSRSGTTIAAGLTCRFDRTFAVRFSFLLSIPAVLVINFINLIDALKFSVDASLLPMYMVGFVTAALFGYLSIRLLNYIAEKGSFGGFSYYCWGAGLVTLALSLVG